MTNEDIIELAIDQALKHAPKVGEIVAMKSEDISHRLIEIRGDVAVVESIDGQLKEWPLVETFDVNLCKRIALGIQKNIN